MGRRRDGCLGPLAGSCGTFLTDTHTHKPTLDHPVTARLLCSYGPSNPVIDRGIALHKMIRLITMVLGGALGCHACLLGVVQSAGAGGGVVL